MRIAGEPNRRRSVRCSALRAWTSNTRVQCEKLTKIGGDSKEETKGNGAIFRGEEEREEGEELALVLPRLGEGDRGTTGKLVICESNLAIAEIEEIGDDCSDKGEDGICCSVGEGGSGELACESESKDCISSDDFSSPPLLTFALLF